MRTSYPKSKIKAVLVEGIHPAAVEAFKGEGFTVESLPKSPEPRKLVELAEGAHILGIRSKTLVTREVLGAAGRLLSVGCFCIGTDQVALGEAAHAGVPVFNSPFGNTRSVAELTIAEVVMLHRRLGEKSAQMHAGVWDKSAAGAHEVRARTLGIVGYGHIGSQVSVLAEAMGMRVIYFDIVPKLPLGNARAAGSLAELLKEADVVTLHVPDTEQTRGMIGAAQIKRMKPGGVLINNARGKVVDLSALAASVKSGHLGGAALDVFPEEPAGAGEAFSSEVRGLANVVLTPHIGGSTEEAQESIARDVAAKLIRFVNVGSTTGAVNVPEVELPEQGGTEGEETSGTGAGRGARRHRILHFHKNVPGVLSRLHAAVAGVGANISASYLRTRDDVGYCVLDVDPTDGEKVLDLARGIPETIKARLLW